MVNEKGLRAVCQFVAKAILDQFGEFLPPDSMLSIDIRMDPNRIPSMSVELRTNYTNCDKPIQFVFADHKYQDEDDFQNVTDWTNLIYKDVHDEYKRNHGRD